MGKIIHPLATCDKCGLRSEARNQVWIKRDKGLFSYHKECYNEMQVR